MIGVLDAFSGRLQAWDYGRATAVRLGRCWSSAVASYPQARKIYLVMGNWPVHFHENALGPLLKDARVKVLPRYPPTRPGSTASRKSGVG